MARVEPARISADAPAFIAPMVIWIQAHAFWAVPSVMFALPLVTYAKEKVGDPSIWAHIKQILEQLRERGFGTDKKAHNHQHRVTLFRYYSWHVSLRRFPWWGGWLVPVERTGHRTQLSSVAFRAPDSGDHCEGIAGATWSKWQEVVVQELPDVRSDYDLATVTRYAEYTYVNPDYVSRTRPQGRSFLGIPVEVSGKRWGVIVIDSVSPNLRAKAIRQEFKSNAKTLGILLSRI